MLELSTLVSIRNEVPVFQALTLSVSAGQAIEVRGANGAGKTTLLRTLAGLHTQYTGEFVVTPLVYQGHRLALDELATPIDNLHWYTEIADLSVTGEQLLDLLDKVGMLKYAMTPVGKLSQGQQRRVAMARWQLCTQLSACRLWLLDEPATALDVQAQSMLRDLLKSHCDAGGAVVYTTHTPLDLPDKQQVEVETHPAIQAHTKAQEDV